MEELDHLPIAKKKMSKDRIFYAFQKRIFGYQKQKRGLGKLDESLTYFFQVYLYSRPYQRNMKVF